MAVRRGGRVAAPVKMKLRKHHGPKRKMFHCWDRSERLDLARDGVLSKYDNFESFAQSCGKRAGIKTFLKDMWDEYSVLKTHKEKDAYLANVVANHDKARIAAENRARKAKKTLTKGK